MRSVDPLEPRCGKARPMKCDAWWSMEALAWSDDPGDSLPCVGRRSRTWALSLGRTLALGLAMAGWGAQGQVIDFISGALVPDGSGSGLVDRRSLSGLGEVSLAEVGIRISGVGDGMINGDIYATLSHLNQLGTVDGFVVLLNRLGKREENDEGYFDSGLSIDLVERGAAPDVHNYRVTLGGSHAVPIGGPLSGLWSVDGRSVDPDLVLDSDPRSTGLEGFSKVDSDSGQWVLFVSDVVGGGQARLDGWSLRFEGSGSGGPAVPEPSTYAVVAGVALVGLAGIRRWRRAAGNSAASRSQ